MPRLHRPYIPLAVRVRVALRQVAAVTMPPVRFGLCNEIYLGVLLFVLFDQREVELHHRPALVNRRRYVRSGKVFYDPPANDPEHLVYLAEDEHDIETRIRGVGAQRSDLGQRRYLKRVAKNRARRTSDSRSKNRPPKRKWPSRPFPKRSKR